MQSHHPTSSMLLVQTQSQLLRCIFQRCEHTERVRVSSRSRPLVLLLFHSDMSFHFMPCSSRETGQRCLTSANSNIRECPVSSCRVEGQAAHSCIEESVMMPPGEVSCEVYTSSISYATNTANSRL